MVPFDPSPLAAAAPSASAKEDSRCCNKRIILLFDDLITGTDECFHAVEGWHRTADEAARPARLYDRDAARKHGKGCAKPQHLSARRFESNRGPGACARRTPVRSPPPG